MTSSYHLFKVVMLCLCLCFPNYRYCRTKTNGKHFNFSVSHINEKFRNVVPDHTVTTPSILFPQHILCLSNLTSIFGGSQRMYIKLPSWFLDWEHRSSSDKPHLNEYARIQEDISIILNYWTLSQFFVWNLKHLITCHQSIHAVHFPSSLRDWKALVLWSNLCGIAYIWD